MLNGVAQFDETIHVNCTILGQKASLRCTAIKYKPKECILSVMALDTGESSLLCSHRIDLSRLLPASVDYFCKPDKPLSATASFQLTGKAEGGVLIATFDFEVLNKKPKLLERNASSRIGEFRLQRVLHTSRTLPNSPHGSPSVRCSNFHCTSPCNSDRGSNDGRDVERLTRSSCIQKSEEDSSRVLDECKSSEEDLYLALKNDPLDLDDFIKTEPVAPSTPYNTQEALKSKDYSSAELYSGDNKNNTNDDETKTALIQREEINVPSLHNDVRLSKTHDHENDVALQVETNGLFLVRIEKAEGTRCFQGECNFLPNETSEGLPLSRLQMEEEKTTLGARLQGFYQDDSGKVLKSLSNCAEDGKEQESSGSIQGTEINVQSPQDGFLVFENRNALKVEETVMPLSRRGKSKAIQDLEDEEVLNTSETSTGSQNCSFQLPQVREEIAMCVTTAPDLRGCFLIEGRTELQSCYQECKGHSEEALKSFTNGTEDNSIQMRCALIERTGINSLSMQDDFVFTKNPEASCPLEVENTGMLSMNIGRHGALEYYEQENFLANETSTGLPKCNFQSQQLDEEETTSVSAVAKLKEYALVDHATKMQAFDHDYESDLEEDFKVLTDCAEDGIVEEILDVTGVSEQDALSIEDDAVVQGFFALLERRETILNGLKRGSGSYRRPKEFGQLVSRQEESKSSLFGCEALSSTKVRELGMSGSGTCPVSTASTRSESANYASKIESEDNTQLVSLIKAAESEMEKAAQALRSKERVRILELAETEALMKAWGLNDKAFTSSKPKKKALKLQGFSSQPAFAVDTRSVVRLRDGGCLRNLSLDHFEARGSLAMNVSKPIVVPGKTGSCAADILHHMASKGLESMATQAFVTMPMEDLAWVTEEQFAMDESPALNRRLNCTGVGTKLTTERYSHSLIPSRRTIDNTSFIAI